MVKAFSNKAYYVIYSVWHKLEVLHQSVKRVKTKSQKVLGPNSYVCRSYRGKTGRAFLAPILNRVKRTSKIQPKF